MDIIKESIALLSDDTLSLDCDSSIMTLLDFFFFFFTLLDFCISLVFMFLSLLYYTVALACYG